MQESCDLNTEYSNTNPTTKNFFSSIKSTDRTTYTRNKKLNQTYELPVNDDINIKGEIALWKSVIMQALVDISSKSNKKMAKVYRLKSGKWLNSRNQDFLRVCSYAELDPDYVLQKAEQIKQTNPFYPNYK